MNIPRRSVSKEIAATGLLTLSNLTFPTNFNSYSMALSNKAIRIMFHGGDNMLGRAVQLTFPAQSPGEEWIRDSCTAQHYVDLSLQHPSTLSRSSNEEPDLKRIRELNQDGGSYLWGETAHLEMSPPPDVRLLNLETAVTCRVDNDDIPRKGINYHMHVDNLPVLNNFCQFSYGSREPPSPVIVSFANNHVMDFGRNAMERETLPAFQAADFQAVGIGRNWQEAAQPAVVNVGQKALHVFAFSSGCSGTPDDWWATSSRSGLVGLPSLYSQTRVEKALQTIKEAIQCSQSSTEVNRPIRMVSIHWGPNWAFGDRESDRSYRRQLAHRMIDECGVDLVYGHSSHHIRGLEIHHKKLIMYGAGDIINDYEGFENAGEDRYNKLGGIFIVDLDSTTGNLHDLRLVPTFMNRLQLRRYTKDSEIWQPSQHHVQRVPDKGLDLCRFINRLSRIDGKDDALILEYQDSDPQINPQGPVLRMERKF